MIMRQSRSAGACAGAALLLFAGLIAAHQEAAGQTTLGRIREDNLVRIAVAGEVPYGYEGEAGRFTGEAPEIARVVIERIDPEIEIEWQTVEFGQLIPGLLAGQFDIAAAGMFITPERCEQVAFSDPTYVIGEALAVKAGNPKDLTDFESISAREDARVGLIAGTVEPNYALVTGIPGDRALLYRDFDQALGALKEGEVDAIALTSLTAQRLVDEENGLEATKQFFPTLDGEEVRGYGAFAFRQEDEALVQAFNEELSRFLGTEEHWELVEPFGFTPEMAPDMTAQILCAD